jgi:hypothetical protein
MTNWRLIALAPAFLLAAACGRKNDQLAADTSLNRDLNLANQVSPYQDTLGAAELNGYATNPSALRSTTPTRTSTATRTTSTYHPSSSSSGTRSSSGSSGTTTTTSNGSVSTSGGTVVKHTQRDAAIGAAAGAVIGATTSRNKVKGGIVGAVVGGVLGGVIGNNVDKTKRPPTP